MTAPVKRQMFQSTEVDEKRFWSKVALPDENGCMLWQAQIAPDGYGRFKLTGASPTPASRVSLWITVGPPPSLLHEAAHSCRNRHCVAPAHLRWATAAENQADKVADGTSTRGDKNPKAKLTWPKAREIRQRLQAGEKQTHLAAEFGVSQTIIWEIGRGLVWVERVPS